MPVNNGWPSYTQEEADAVQSVLLSNKVNYWSGQLGREFEKSFSIFAETKYSVAVANGTVALDLALHAVGVSQGDEVIVTSRTFIASVSAIVNAGAIPVFADVDLNSQNITAESIRPLVSPKTKAIVCVHLAGWPCEMDEIMALASEFDLKVVEDCAQAHGAKYRGRSVGGLGHVGTWSFCQDKIMTTGGEGGMVTTNDESMWSEMWSFKDHGRSYDAVYNREHAPGHRWFCESFGTNWRLTEMQAAIGLIQLDRMAEWHLLRKANYEKLDSVCREFRCLRTPDVPSYIDHAGYRFYTFINSDELKRGWGQDRIVRAINDQVGVCMHGSCSEVYLEKAFDNTGWRPKERLQNAKKMGESSIAFLIHPTLTEQDVNDVSDAIRSVLIEASL